jgi:hypothetical protein
MIRPPLLFLLILATTTTLTSAYPNWLKCYVDLDTSENVMGAAIMEYDEAEHKVYVEIKGDDDDAWTTNGFEYNDGDTTVTARLKIPDVLNDTGDAVMYVMETTDGATLSPPFCKGRRGVGRQHDYEITVAIDGSKDRVELWAGWARGYEAVKLTKRTVLWKKGKKPDHYEEDDDEVEAEL